LIGRHNIHFYHRLMDRIRESILQGSFETFYRAQRDILAADDLDNPVTPMRRNPPRSLSLGDYRIHTAREGFSSILHVSSGEIMHSRTAPMDEACALYIDQSRLSERLLEAGNPEPLKIWDVGLGAAANAMAAIRCFESAGASARPLRIISFENDLDSLRLAFRNNDLFPYLRHGGPAAILKSGLWQSKSHPGLEWVLHEGDFLKLLDSADTPDLIFYDMFSGKTCAPAWTQEAFERVMSRCAGRDVELFTYTCSTASRVAMLAAGFGLARGCNAGDKEETTIAFTSLEAARRRGRDVLGLDWLARWERSAAQFPSSLDPASREDFAREIRARPQFQIRPETCGSSTAA
jgi:queuine tRNA-ribosyltransferase